MRVLVQHEPVLFYCVKILLLIEFKPSFINFERCRVGQSLSLWCTMFYYSAFLNLAISFSKFYWDNYFDYYELWILR